MSTKFEKDVGITVISGSDRFGTKRKVHNPIIKVFVDEDFSTRWFTKVGIVLKKRRLGEFIVG